ncbi:serine/threonine-protein kinase [Streptomyces sp. NBC_00401]|uniref:serine/threonine-protein kinase n=1 Tax=unclassified Streptomyces TaxID=2593676 RepID=UPI002255DD5C|nr:serine/threonine-protein kinase [Streptomyces sp. NBC_00401]MCX5079577.1 serine/threonine protein kinase [Streptomyces sp. NBC_00401]
MTSDRRAAPPAFQALSADDPHEIGGYRLCARLGSGGMGHVYLAFTPGGRPVALKAVRPELAGDTAFRHRFAQEVTNTQRVHGLYTAPVIDSGTDAATPWLATAYVPGPSLHEVVHRHGPLPVPTVLLLMAGIAEALQAIHAAGVVHRDLKPANVLLASDGPRVIDFGIARAADAVALTSAGLQIGTPAFMAPEQALGAAATPATDVFALGALAVYAVCGAPPFGSGPESAALYRVVHEQPDLTHVPPELQNLLWQCLAKNPEDRPTTGALIEAVRHHPAAGAQLRFTDGWLPHPIRADIAGRSDLPEPLQPSHAQPTITATPTAPARTDTAVTAQPAPPPAPARRRRRRRWVVPTVTVAVLVAGATAYRLSDSHGGPSKANGPGGRDRSSAPPARPHSSPPSKSTASPGTGYRQVYAETELTSPDPSYEFDLGNGTVSPESTAAWYLARTADAFEFPDDSDAYIAYDDTLSPGGCEEGIDSEPVTTLKFDDLEEWRPFCIRGANGKDIAIVHLIDAPTTSESVTVSVRHYRRTA